MFYLELMDPVPSVFYIKKEPCDWSQRLCVSKFRVWLFSFYHKFFFAAPIFSYFRAFLFEIERKVFYQMAF